MQYVMCGNIWQGIGGLFDGVRQEVPQSIALLLGVFCSLLSPLPQDGTGFLTKSSPCVCAVIHCSRMNAFWTAVPWA